MLLDLNIFLSFILEHRFVVTFFSPIDLDPCLAVKTEVTETKAIASNSVSSCHKVITTGATRCNNFLNHVITVYY